jgi:hypothetical protein
MTSEQALECIARVVARRLEQPVEGERDRDALVIIRAVVNAAQLERRLFPRGREGGTPPPAPDATAFK